MIRNTALVLVLTFAGTPAATAACFVWCGSSCPPAHSQQHVAISTGQESCEKLFVVAPGLREDSRREHQRPPAHSSFDTARTATLDFEHRSAACVVSREHAPPLHQKPPTVLRRSMMQTMHQQ